MAIPVASKPIPEGVDQPGLNAASRLMMVDVCLRRFYCLFAGRTSSDQLKAKARWSSKKFPRFARRSCDLGGGQGLSSKWASLYEDACCEMDESWQQETLLFAPSPRLTPPGTFTAEVVHMFDDRLVWAGDRDLARPARRSHRAAVAACDVAMQVKACFPKVDC